jgi:hypothetical protein
MPIKSEGEPKKSPSSSQSNKNHLEELQKEAQRGLEGLKQAEQHFVNELLLREAEAAHKAADEIAEVFMTLRNPEFRLALGILKAVKKLDEGGTPIRYIPSTPSVYSSFLPLSLGKCAFSQFYSHTEQQPTTQLPEQHKPDEG